jgi:hypothetical protein
MMRSSQFHAYGLFQGFEQAPEPAVLGNRLSFEQRTAGTRACSLFNLPVRPAALTSGRPE